MKLYKKVMTDKTTQTEEQKTQMDQAIALQAQWLFSNLYQGNLLLEFPL